MLLTFFAHAQPSDLTVYVAGNDTPPAPVDYGARATVSWTFARAGIRVAWRDGAMERVEGPLATLRIQVRFTGEDARKTRPDALAYAMPFGNGATAIAIMYNRIRWVAHGLTREPALLAHVLAHEIGHYLQSTNAHSASGIMKARWTGEDYDAMQRGRLSFTSDDVRLIHQGLEIRKKRSLLKCPREGRPSGFDAVAVVANQS